MEMYTCDVDCPHMCAYDKHKLKHIILLGVLQL